MSTVIKILPCPFCGSDELIFNRLPGDGTITFYKLHHPPESECSISMTATGQQELIQKWNKRHHPSK